MEKNKKQSKGFTLLELLIVIAVLAILSAALVLVLNPAESMKKSRDTQRMNDLAALKTAIGLYITSVGSPDLDAAIGGCLGDDGLGAAVTDAKIFYSANETEPQACIANVVEGADANGTFDTGAGNDFCVYSSASALVDGTGWLPVKLSDIPGGSPISNLPIDPTNIVAAATTPASADLVYRYACQNAAVDGSGKPSTVFEVNAQLESDAFTATGSDKRALDGGDHSTLYEVGTNLRLLGNGVNF